MAEQNLLPEIPDLKDYSAVKQELTERIAKLNAIEVLTDENHKEIKKDIAEITKV